MKPFFAEPVQPGTSIWKGVIGMFHQYIFDNYTQLHTNHTTAVRLSDQRIITG